jgi:hypothetical protein
MFIYSVIVLTCADVCIRKKESKVVRVLSDFMLMSYLTSKP